MIASAIPFVPNFFSFFLHLVVISVLFDLLVADVICVCVCVGVGCVDSNYEEIWCVLVVFVSP